jgi:chorismate lyase/3-hydroxybenzoate synthase
MAHGWEKRDDAALNAPRSPRIGYRAAASGTASVLGENTLAAFGFGEQRTNLPDDPRWLEVALPQLGTPPAFEVWEVDGPVERGYDGEVRWSLGGGWLFAAIEVDERRHGSDPDAAAAHAYAELCRVVSTHDAHHVQRIWNYLGDINRGDGDDERYKRFCHGRVRGMGDFFASGYPAATAIGHHAAHGLLQVYLLATGRPGTRVENPRQVSAWQYPRQYGRTPPSFARGTLLPAHDLLAISGTAAVVGHASAHHDDHDAQLQETLLNLETLLGSAGAGHRLGPRSPLKAYVRHAEDFDRVHRFAETHWPDVPLVVLHGDICRSELLVEIDGWSYTGEAVDRG